MTEPAFMLQTVDKCLHFYRRKDTLLRDIENDRRNTLQAFVLVGGFRSHYRPITTEELREFGEEKNIDWEIESEVAVEDKNNE